MIIKLLKNLLLILGFIGCIIGAYFSYTEQWEVSSFVWTFNCSVAWIVFFIRNNQKILIGEPRS